MLAVPSVGPEYEEHQAVQFQVEDGSTNPAFWKSSGAFVPKIRNISLSGKAGEEMAQRFIDYEIKRREDLDASEIKRKEALDKCRIEVDQELGSWRKRRKF